MTDLIPQTQILSEATLEALQEVLSLDVEKYTPEHRIRIITTMREWQQRIAAADAAGKRIARAPKVAQQQIAHAKSEDLF